MSDKSPPLSQLNKNQIQWIGAGFLLTLSSLPGQTIFIAQFNSSLREVFSLSHGEFGGLYTLSTLASSALLIFAGGLVDRLSTRVIALLCIAGLALVSISMANVTNIFVLGFVIFGLRFFGQGMLGLIAMTAMSRWFNRFRGRALSLAQMGAASGEAVFPFLITLAIGIIGWRQVWLMAAVALVVVLVPIIFFLLRNAPEQAQPFKQSSVNAKTNPNFDAEAEVKPTGRKWKRSRLLRDPLFWLILPGFMAPWAINTLFVFHQAHLSVLKGWDITTFTAFFPVLSLSVILVSLGAGVLVDRFGAWRILPFYLIPQGIGCIVIGLLDPVWTIPAFFVFFGTTMGTSGPIVGALLTELYGTIHLGSIRALITSVLVLASALGPGLAGWWIDIGFDLDGQAFVYGAYCFGMVGLFFIFQKSFGKRVKEIQTESVI